MGHCSPVSITDCSHHSSSRYIIDRNNISNISNIMRSTIFFAVFVVVGLVGVAALPVTEDEESEKLVEAVEEALVAEESDDALVDAQLANEPETESQFFPSTSSFFPSTSFGVFPSYGFPSFGFQDEEDESVIAAQDEN